MATIFVNSRVIDSILYVVDKGTLAIIVSARSREIAAQVMAGLGRGATLLKGVGAYSGEEKEVLLCAVRKQQFHKLKTIAHEVDPNAFVIVTEAGEIYGEGFKSIERRAILPAPGRAWRGPSSGSWQSGSRRCCATTAAFSRWAR